MNQEIEVTQLDVLDAQVDLLIAYVDLMIEYPELRPRGLRWAASGHRPIRRQRRLFTPSSCLYLLSP